MCCAGEWSAGSRRAVIEVAAEVGDRRAMPNPESETPTRLETSEDPAEINPIDFTKSLLEGTINRGYSLWRAAITKRPTTTDRFELIMLAFFARVLRDSRAVHRLWTVGFGPECWVVGRPLIELALQAALLRQDRLKYANAYFIHGKIMRYQSAVKAQGLIDRGLTKAPPGMNFLDQKNPRIAELAKIYHDHKNEFIKNKKPERLWENWWKGSIAKLAAEVRPYPKYGQSLYDEYHFGYANASLYVHSSERVMVDIMETDGGVVRIREPTIGSEPSVPFHTARRLLQICIFFDDAFQLGFKDELECEWEAANEALRESDSQLGESRSHEDPTQGIGP
jgi:hypothetical protein